MKAGRPHRVPLAERALKVLDAARDLSDGSGLCFPSVRGGVISDNALSTLLRDLGVPAVPHGMRSSFRDWAANARMRPGRYANSPSPMSTAIASKPPTGDRTCSSAAGP